MPLIHVVKSFLHNPLDLPRNIIWRFPQTKSRQKHIFIIGAPRSGTTLLKSILCAHPSFKGVTCETTGFFNYLNLFDKDRYIVLEKYDRFDWREIYKIANNSKDIVNFFDNFCAAFLKKFNKIRFVEKINSITLNRVDFLIKHFPESQFIHISRDGRDCYCSAHRHPNVPQAKSLGKFARYWRNCINSRLKAGNITNIYDIQYEKLTSNPEQEIKKIIDFLGEIYYPNLIEPHSYGKSFLRQFAHHQNLSQPINNSSQGRWKKELNTDEIEQFHKIAGKQLEKLGYEI